MRGYLKSFLLLFMLCCTGTALAAVVGATESCDETSGNTCAANLYCDNTPGIYKCARCDTLAGGAYPTSTAGSTGKAACYQECKDIPVTLGTQTKNAERVHYNTNNQICTHNLTCVDNAEANAEATACQCTEHYKETNNTCTGKCYALTLVKNLTNVAEPAKSLYVKYGTGFYKNAECTGTSLATSDTWVTPTFNWWQVFNGYSSSADDKVNLRFNSDGKPTNGTTSTTFTGNTTLYGQWNAGSYTIEYYINSETTYDGGTQTCNVVDANTNSPTTNNCKAKSFPEWCKIIDNKGKAITGWTKNKGGTAAQIELDSTVTPESASTIKLYAVWKDSPSGHYCESTGSNGLKKCPAGSTSPEGSSAQTDCYISNATWFKDKSGKSFQLPIGNINYK